MKKLFLFLSLIILLFGYSKKKIRQLNFFCGSAVKVPMDEIVSGFEKKIGIKINVIYSGSGNLLSQMELSKLLCFTIN